VQCATRCERGDAAALMPARRCEWTQGGVHVAAVSRVPELVQKMLGQTLVTKQSGAEGKPVRGAFLIPSGCSAVRNVKQSKKPKQLKKGSRGQARELFPEWWKHSCVSGSALSATPSVEAY
jgi:hypothetical protein